MKNRPILLILIALLPILLLTAMTQATANTKSKLTIPQSNDGTIGVTVIAQDTGEPVYAEVELLFSDGQFIARENTGPYAIGGEQAIFENLDISKQYKLYIDTDQTYTLYLNEYFDGKTSQYRNSTEEFTEIFFPIGESVIELTATLDHSAVIEGNVIAADTGLPISDVRIETQPYSAHSNETGSNGELLINTTLYGGLVSVTLKGQGDYLPHSFAVETTKNMTVAVGTISLQHSGAITGQVTSSLSNLPLSNISITLHDVSGPNTDKYTSTDADGYYSFSQGIASDMRYSIRVNGNCYNIYDCYDGDSTTITGTTNYTTTNINFSLDKYSVIAGEVIASDTNNYLESKVTLYKSELGSDGNFYMRYEAAENLSPWADEFIFKVDAGEYYLEASEIDSPYIGEFYDGKNRETADPITVQQGQVITGLVFTLDLGETVSGQILNKGTNEPVEWSQVSLLNEDGQFSYYASADENGMYEITGISPGSYYLKAEASQYETNFYPDNKSIENADLIEISAGSTNNYDLNLAPWFYLSGTVKSAEDSSPLNQIKVTINESSDYVQTYEDGIFEFQFDAAEMEEEYITLYFEQQHCGVYSYQARCQFVSQFYGEDDLNPNGIQIPIANNQSIPNLEILLAKGGIISGTIKGVDSGLPIVDSAVNLYDSAGKRVTYNRTSDSGTFELTALKTGEYYLYIRGLDNYLGQYLGGSQVLTESQKINVIQGETTFIEDSLETGGVIVARFTDFQTGELITNTDISLELFDQNGYDNKSSNYDRITNETGVITMLGLRTGNFYPWVFPEDGYASEHIEIEHDMTSNTAPIFVTEGTTVTVDFPLHVGGTIKGSIAAADNGIKFSSARVNLFQLDTTCGGKFLIEYTDSNGDGVFAFDHLKPNETYQVEIQRLDYLSTESTQYFPEQSDPIFLEDLDQIEISFKLQGGGRITGQIIDSDTSSPISGVSISFMEQVTHGGVISFNQVGSASTDNNGMYSSPALQNGAYYITLKKTWPTYAQYIPEIYDDIIYGQYSDLALVDPIPVSILNGQDTVVNEELTRDTGSGGKITGTIETADGSELVAPVKINAYLKTPKGLRFIRSGHVFDSDSNEKEFFISGLIDGDYHLEFVSDPSEGEAYRTTWYGNSQNHEDSVVITITNQGTVEDLNIQLALGGAIEGRLDAWHTPTAYLFFRYWVNTASIYNNQGELVSTSKVPHYDPHIFSGLWPGSYYVYFHSFERPVQGTCNDRLYNGEWYGGASSFEDATPIVITGTEYLTDINGELSLDNPPPSLPDQPPAANSHKLSGTVTADGEPLPGVTITADNGATAMTDSNGEYSFYLEDGSHTLTPSKNGTTFNPASRTVTLNGADLSGQDFAATPLPTGTLSGIVTEDDSSLPLEGVDVLAYEQNGSAWQFAQIATTDENGAYQLNDLVAANYKLLFRTPLQTHKSEYYDNASSFNQGVAVALASGGSATDIHASLEKRPEAAIIAAGIESYTDPDTGEVTLTGNRSENSSVTISRNVSCESGDPADVQLIIGSKAFDMDDAGDGTYSATLNIPGDVASDSDQNVSVQYVCDGFTETISVGELVLYDPSGIITDAETGEPIVDASVTLYRVAGASPDTGSTTNECRTVDTRPTAVTNLPFGAWSDVPAADITAGHPVDAAFDTLNGQALFSPAVPTQVTGEDGKYGWDVAEGCWYIVVEAEGFNTLVSPMVGVPPAVLDLDIALSKPAPPPPPPPISYDILLPMIGR